MKYSKNLLKVNLVFIFVFLNLWDFVITRSVLSGMLIGIFMFGLVSILWFLGKFRAIVLITLISIFEFMVMGTFVLEGFQLSGASYSLKSVYWLPFLVMSGINAFWGLKIYSAMKDKKIRTFGSQSIAG